MTELITHTKSTFMQLPDELQIKILGELPIQDLLKSTAVCLKWKELIYDGSLWTTIDVTPFYKSIPIEHILKLVKSSARFLKTANFRGCIQLTGHGLRTLSEYCPNLEVLILKDCRGLSAASIGFLLQKSTQLKILDVSGLDTVKTSTLLSVKPTLNKLEKLNISWCRNITGYGIISMVTYSPYLNYLKLNGCPQLDDDTMAFLGKHLTHLSHLSLAACTSFTDSAMLSFLKTHASTKLTHLNLSSCARLTDATLRNLAIYSTGITHLELAGCILMTDQGFTFLSSRMRTLVHLDLEDLQQITEVTVKSIANHQPNLKRLCLSNCTQISDGSIIHLVLNGICHKLQHIELDNCTITDSVLHTIANYLQKHHQEQKKKRLSLQHITTNVSSSFDSNISFFSSDSSLALVKQQESREEEKEAWIDRRLSIEVLDCSNITEIGVREALAKASPMLTIKSFYSFQEDEIINEQETVNDEDSLDNIHRFGTSSSNRNSRYSSRTSIGGGRRGHSAGQSQSSSGNCIIL